MPRRKTPAKRSPEEQARYEAIQAKRRATIERKAQEARERPTAASTPPPPSDGPAPSQRTVRGSGAGTGAIRDVDAAALAGLHEIVVLGVGGLFLFGEMVYPQMARWEPQPVEVDSIFKPLERIYLRHYDLPTVSPDAADWTAFFIGLSTYGSRVILSRRDGPRPANPFTGPTARTAAHGPAGAAPPGQSAGGPSNGHAAPGAGPVSSAQSIMEDLYAASYVPDSAADGE